MSKMILLASTLINATEHTIVYILDLSQLFLVQIHVCLRFVAVSFHTYIYIYRAPQLFFSLQTLLRENNLCVILSQILVFLLFY